MRPADHNRIRIGYDAELYPVGLGLAEREIGVGFHRDAGARHVVEHPEGAGGHVLVGAPEREVVEVSRAPIILVL